MWRPERDRRGCTGQPTPRRGHLLPAGSRDRTGSSRCHNGSAPAARHDLIRPAPRSDGGGRWCSNAGSTVPERVPRHSTRVRYVVLSPRKATNDAVDHGSAPSATGPASSPCSHRRRCGNAYTGNLRCQGLCRRIGRQLHFATAPAGGDTRSGARRIASATKVLPSTKTDPSARQWASHVSRSAAVICQPRSANFIFKASGVRPSRSNRYAVARQPRSMSYHQASRAGGPPRRACLRGCHRRLMSSLGISPASHLSPREVCAPPPR